MVTDENPQILNCNIQFYFKSIEQTITFKLCFIAQFKCNGLHYSFTTLDKQSCFLLQYLLFFYRNPNELFYHTIIEILGFEPDL